MPRPPRPIADGLIYHVINRGNNRQSVFLGEGDYGAFLQAIADLKERKPFDLYGYCLFHRSGGHVWQGRFKSPVIQDDEHLLTVLRYIEANPLRANLVEHAGEYRWSSFACHGNGRADELLAGVPAYELLASQPAGRQRRWSAYVHRTPDETELAAIRRSSETGLPYGARAWTDRLCRRLNIDLTIRPRGRPRKNQPIEAIKEF